MMKLGCWFVFITGLAKVFGLINISWLIVLAPIMLYFMFWGLILILAMIIALFAD